MNEPKRIDPKELRKCASLIDDVLPIFRAAQMLLDKSADFVVCATSVSKAATGLVTKADQLGYVTIECGDGHAEAMQMLRGKKVAIVVLGDIDEA